MSKKSRNHRRNRARKEESRGVGWDRVIEPNWIPDCPICSSYKQVERYANDSLIWMCMKCMEDFVVYENGESIPVDDLKNAHKWSKQQTKPIVVEGSSKYRLGNMVEEFDYAAG